MQLTGSKSSSTQEGLSREELGQRMHESDKQAVHDQWWLMTLFAALVPFGMSLAISLRPLKKLMSEDPEWSPSFSEQDMVLLDGAMLAPGVIIPVLMGIAMDAVWSVNLSVLVCLIGSVMGSFFVAMGFAWHSFGLALTGRVISGFCMGSLFVVVDVIATQFNRRRKGVTFGLISAVKTGAIYLNTYWMKNFTTRSLDADYEKMDDVLLISALVSLGIGFLWSPLVASFNMDDSVKRRKSSWKWHIGGSIWSLALCTMIVGMFYSNVFFEELSTSSTGLLASTILIGPVLGYWLDVTDKSQDGSLSITNLLVGATWLFLLGQMLRNLMGVDWGISGIAIGVFPMLLRLAVPQVSRRDNLCASFGIIECASFLSGILVHDSEPLTFLNQLILLAVALFLFTFVTHRVKQKWNVTDQSRLEQLIEPLQARGA